MNTLLLLQDQNLTTQASNRFTEGGPFFMTLILICLIVAIVLQAIGFLNHKKNPDKVKKMITLSSDVSILGLVIGLLGSIIGMMEAFDAIESIENMSQNMIAGGLKVSFLTALFGSVTFIIARIGIIILKALQKA